MSVAGADQARDGVSTQVRHTISTAQDAATSTMTRVRDHYRRHVRGLTNIRMVPGSLEIEGREMRYAISSNELRDPKQVWAINIHGYLAGATMYNRESERLAESFGWRVINPSLPGFGGSEPLPWDQISMESLVDRIDQLVEHFGINEVLLIGHSMGAGVAMQYAAVHPERVLGVIYRDGVATPAWHDRHGLLPIMVATIAPDLAPLADMAASIAVDIPDLFIGRALSTARSLIPDLRHNVKVLAQTLPIASMLMAIDQRDDVASVTEKKIPVLAVWGCFDRVTPRHAAEEFSAIAHVPIQWVPGGHSWMLARPTGQVDVLRYLESGQEFLTAVEGRAKTLRSRRPRLRSVS
jgi:pimeloyl-ACP methyl ester carboxylesterase